MKTLSSILLDTQNYFSYILNNKKQCLINQCKDLDGWRITVRWERRPEADEEYMQQRSFFRIRCDEEKVLKNRGVLECES